jgi:hypothetical protein
MKALKKISGCYKIILLTFLFSGIIIDSYSQTIVNSSQTNEIIYLARNKQFNEFLDRFNYKTDLRGNPIDSAFSVRMPREKYLNSLFDLKDPRIMDGSNTYSKSFVETKVRFIDEVLKTRTSINKYSGNIIAEAKSRITINGTPKSMSIFLCQEKVGNNMSKWVITDVRGEILNFLKTDSSRKRYLPPTSNETDFIDLKRAMEDVSYLQYYASGDYKIDLLSVFFYCISSKIIRFEYVEEVNYHILDIPGWCVKVKDFNRNEMNSGWLIYDLAPNKLLLKDYLKSLSLQ